MVQYSTRRFHSHSAHGGSVITRVFDTVFDFVVIYVLVFWSFISIPYVVFVRAIYAARLTLPVSDRSDKTNFVSQLILVLP